MRCSPCAVMCLCMGLHFLVGVGFHGMRFIAGATLGSSRMSNCWEGDRNGRMTRRRSSHRTLQILGSYFLLMPLREETGISLGTDTLPTLFVASLVLTLFATPAASWFLRRASDCRQGMRDLYRTLAVLVLGESCNRAGETRNSGRASCRACWCCLDTRNVVCKRMRHATYKHVHHNSVNQVWP